MGSLRRLWGTYGAIATCCRVLGAPTWLCGVTGRLWGWGSAYRADRDAMGASLLLRCVERAPPCGLKWNCTYRSMVPSAPVWPKVELHP